MYQKVNLKEKFRKCFEFVSYFVYDGIEPRQTERKGKLCPGRLCGRSSFGDFLS